MRIYRGNRTKTIIHSNIPWSSDGSQIKLYRAPCPVFPRWKYKYCFSVSATNIKGVTAIMNENSDDMIKLDFKRKYF